MANQPWKLDQLSTLQIKVRTPSFSRRVRMIMGDRGELLGGTLVGAVRDD